MMDIDIDIAASICSNYDLVMMSGNHGDPIYHPQLPELVAAIRARQPSITFEIVTNGSFRSERWWMQLAPLLTKRDSITFSIDGLPYNNHLYRVNSRWPTVEAGIRTLRAANPEVRMCWKWIIFSHNQDDIPAGIDMARSLGFNELLCIWSTRYEQQHQSLIPTKTFEQIRDSVNAAS